MKRYIFYILILLSVDVNRPVYSQVKPIITFTEEDGLASNDVKDIIRDKNGILWIATNLGLTRYDGETFQNIYKSNGLPSNRVWSVAVDSGNTLYAGCFKDGLAVIKNGKVVRKLYTYGKFSNTFRKLYYSNYYKKLLVGTDNGLYVLNDTILLPVIYTKDTTNKSQILSFSEHGSRIFFTVLKGNTDGLYELFINRTHPEKSYAKRISERGRFASVVLNDTLYSSDYNGILKNPLANIDKQYSNSKVDSLFFIWNMLTCGTNKLIMGGLGEGRFSGGVTIYDTKTKEFYSDANFKDKQTINKILPDSLLSITWFCKENGLVCEMETPFEIFDFKGIGNILDIGFSGDSLLVLTEHAVNYFNGKNLKPIITKNEICNRAYNERLAVSRKPSHIAIGQFDASRGCEFVNFIQDEKKLYITTAMGLLSLPNLNKYYPFGVGMFKFTSNGSFLAVVNYTPLQYYPSSKNLKEFKIFNNIQDVFEIIESNGIYYLASHFNGLYAIKDSLVFKIDETNSEIDNHLTDIDKNADGNVWCCSASGNVFEIYFTDSLFIKRVLNSSNAGLVGNSCKWLKFNQKNLFIGTNKGLNIISIANLGSSCPRVELFYNQHNGYEYISASSPVVDKNGYLYVHTKDKIIRVKPEFSIDTTLNIIFNNAKINNLRVDIDLINRKKLSFSTKQLSFYFSAIKYPTTKNLSYRYKINNGDWTDGNLVSLQSLRSGKYSVEMEVFNRATNTQHTRTLEFSIKKPFWLTWWFILSCISVLIVGFIQVMRFRVKRLKKQHKEKSALITQNSELRLRSLQIQMNPHFIFNALNSVQGYIINKNTQSALVYIGNIASIIRSNLENASNEYIHLTEEIDFLKKYAEIEVNRFKDILQIDFINNVSDGNILVPPMIIQPIIENAVKHGIRGLKKNGRITVTFNTNDETLVVIVEDNGVGRAYAQQLNRSEHNGKGMKIISERLTLLNEKNHTDLHQLQITDLFENTTPIGTRVIIQLMLVKST